MATGLWQSGFTEDASLRWEALDEPTCTDENGDTCKGHLDSCNMPTCTNLRCDAHALTVTINGVLYEGVCALCVAELQRFPMPRIQRAQMAEVA